MEDIVRETKEAFVSNLTGTSWQEVSAVVVLPSLSILLFSVTRISLLILNSHVFGRESPRNGVLRLMKTASDFVVENSTLVFPLLLILTVMSDTWLVLFTAILFCFIPTLAITCKNLRSEYVTGIQSSNVLVIELTAGAVKWFRSYVNILTAICILAVDFHVYPRRLAKTETFGTGLMDIFVGAFIMCNSIVCTEARDADMYKRGAWHKVSHFKKSLTSAIPLLVLGGMRLLATKGSNYQEHVAEYGVHWNFFMTLAFTKVICTALLCIIPASLSLYMGIALSMFYQFMLSNGLEEVVLQPGKRDAGLLLANREGIFSLIGYIALYLIGVSIGRYLFSEKRENITSSIKCTFSIFVVSIALIALKEALELFDIKTSRRLANLPFLAWSVHLTLLMIGSFMLVITVQHAIDAVFREKLTKHQSVLLDAVNYNPLGYFLLANILTGMVNFTVDTLQKTDTQSLFILVIYISVLNAVAIVLFSYKRKIKIW